MAGVFRARFFPPPTASPFATLTRAQAATLSGTVTAATIAADIVAGGKTIILTLLGDTWVASGATFNAQRAAIIAGLTSAQAEAGGWNNTVRALQGVAGVVRTDDYTVTITLDAQAGYAITVTETITVTIPNTAVTDAGAIIAVPTFTVSPVAVSGKPILIYARMRKAG